MQSKLYDKIVSCQRKNFSQTSKEKIINIVSDDLSTLSEFHEQLTQKFCRLLRSLIPLVTIFIINVYAGLVVMAVAILDYFLINFAGKKISLLNKEIKESKDKIYEGITEVVEGQGVINEFYKEKECKEKYIVNVDQFNKNYRRKYIWVSFRDNWIYIIWNLIVYLVTFFLVYLVSNGSLNVGAYLIMVPYLTTCTENFSEVFKISETIKDVKICLDRVNTVLNFSKKEFAKFGKNKYSMGDFNLSFIGVSYSTDREYSEYEGEIKDVDISFKNRDINVVYGDKQCGKRVIFNILRRRIQPKQGVVLLDNIDIFQYSRKSFKKHIYYVAGNPQFLNTSIINNLSIIVKNKKTIIECCKKVGVYDWIMKQPLKFNTIINESISKFRLFQLGLVRTLLTGCEVFIVYEFPKEISEAETKQLKNLLVELKTTKTVIIFTHNSYFSDMAGITYKIENGKVADFSINK